MIDFLWWLHSDVPFWEKMYAMTMIAGVTFFIIELFAMLEGWNIKLKRAIAIVKESYRAEIVKQKSMRRKHEN